MSTNEKIWDVIVAGGGVAGLSFACLCSDSGLSVLVIEKEEYPRHKVCGEYISMESYDFLTKIGISLSELNLPRISNFVLTSHFGLTASCSLGQGGFGMSRYMLDDMLAGIVRGRGVEILTGHQVISIENSGGLYHVKTRSQINYRAKIVVGAFGRVSGFSGTKRKKQPKYIGVKYHIEKGPQEDTIEIHTFEGGYCGISKVENDRYCLCYIARASDLKSFGGNIQAYEDAVLKENPYLRKRFEARRITNAVITSQIHFGTGNIFEKGFPQIGDAAGFIPPITGNGISLALRSAKILHKQVVEYLLNRETLDKLLIRNKNYVSGYLSFRIKKGIFLQNLLFIKNKRMSRMLNKSLVTIPGLMRLLTMQAVGKSI